jgi:excinuclease UvrABC nuclease subunit
MKETTNISIEYDRVNIKNWFKYNIDVPVEINRPDNCGVYLIYTKQSELLYIGKAANLRTRLSTHLTLSNVSNLLKYNLTDLQKVTPLMDNVDVCITKNITNAEILEISLISQLNPIFNRQYNSTFHWGKVNEKLCEAKTDDQIINQLTVSRGVTEYID